MRATMSKDESVRSWMDGMAEPGKLETVTPRKAIRPVLIASRRNVAEHTTILRHLLVGLADESVAVGLVTPAQCDVECLAPTPVSVFSHPLIDLPILEPFVVDPLGSQIEKFRPTVLHCLCESRAALVKKLASRLNVPYILSVNSLAYPFSGLPVCARRCARIVAAAPAIAAQIAKSHLGFADRIQQINMGTFAQTDIVCFADPSRMPSVVVACPLHHAGRLMNFFDAVKALLDEGREFMTVIMGSGREDRRLRKRLVSIGLSPSVTIVPVLDPWLSVLAAADIFVQPQPSRSFSVFMLEAMALGVAVATCTGGVDNLIMPGKTAVTFDPADRSSIHKALAQLLDDHEFARSVARAGQDHIRANHTVSAMVAAMLELYVAVRRQSDR